MVQELINKINQLKPVKFLNFEKYSEIKWLSPDDEEFFGTINMCSSNDCYDDGSQYIETVLHFPKWNCYVQVVGYYTSYDGFYFEECFQVEPEEYTATRYNKIKIKD